MEASETFRSSRRWIIRIAVALLAVVLYVLYIRGKQRLGLTGIPILWIILLIVMIVRIGKEPLLRVRWGFKAALLGLLGVLVILFYVQGQQLRGKGKAGLLEASYVTKGYARQVLSELVRRIAIDIQPPRELYQWRESGRFEKEPAFAQGTLCWLTYDAASRSFQHHAVDSLSFDPHVFDARLAAGLDSALDKGAAIFGRQYEEQGGEYSIKGKFFPGEPRFVGTLMDIDAFNRRGIPELLTFAQENYPSLRYFTTEKNFFKHGNSNFTKLTLRFRDKNGEVVAQIGTAGEYENQPVDPREGFMLTFPEHLKPGTKTMTIETIVPYSTEMVLKETDRMIWMVTVMLFATAMVLWARAEVRLSKAKKMP